MVMDKGAAFVQQLREKEKGVQTLQQESVLQEAQRLINGDRNDSYGHCLDDYSRTAGLFNAAFAHKLKAPLSAEDLMLTLILVKISRQVHKSKRDNLTDICGYAGCVEKSEQERERRSKVNGLVGPGEIWQYNPPPSGCVR